MSDNGENIYKQLTNHGAYVLLTVWTENVKGDLSISVDKTGLIPDNTNPILADIHNFEAGIYKKLVAENSIIDIQNFQNTYASYTYRFFVDGEITLSVKDFLVIIDGVEAVEGVIS